MKFRVILPSKRKIIKKLAHRLFVNPCLKLVPQIIRKRALGGISSNQLASFLFVAGSSD
jgi:hypothetical protein